MERGGMEQQTALLTELFVEDMDAQLRETGVGDVVVGKRMGRLMSVLGGRLGAFRVALADTDPAPLEAALERNVTMQEGRRPDALARRLRAFADKLGGLADDEVLAGRIAL
jgi:cytochrome b pre-mRNA-processing protein 3